MITQALCYWVRIIRISTSYICEFTIFISYFCIGIHYIGWKIFLCRIKVIFLIVSVNLIKVRSTFQSPKFFHRGKHIFHAGYHFFRKSKIYQIPKITSFTIPHSSSRFIHIMYFNAIRFFRLTFIISIKYRIHIIITPFPFTPFTKAISISVLRPLVCSGMHFHPIPM